MAEVEPIIHFGNFLRWQEDRFGGPAEFARKSGITFSSLSRYNRTAHPEELNMRPYNRDRLAAALGFVLKDADKQVVLGVDKQPAGDWSALDKAWQSTPMPPYPVKETSSLPPYAKHLADTGQLKMPNPTPAAVIAAVARLSHEGQVAVAKSMPAEVIEEVAGAATPSADSRNLKPQGVLLNYQLDALAQAPDMETFERMVKEIRKHLRNRRVEH